MFEKEIKEYETVLSEYRQKVTDRMARETLSMTREMEEKKKNCRLMNFLF